MFVRRNDTTTVVGAQRTSDASTLTMYRRGLTHTYMHPLRMLCVVKYSFIPVPTGWQNLLV